MTAMNQEQVQQSNSQEQEPAQASSKAWEGQEGADLNAGALIPSVRVESLVATRDDILRMVRESLALLLEADRLAVSGGFGSLWTEFADCVKHSRYKRYSDECDPTHKILCEYAQALDAAGWQHLLSASGLLSFMDSKARNEWNECLAKKEAPAFTLDNALATFQQLYEVRGDMVERGVLEVFRGLSWDYKTNLPCLFGKRLVVRNVSRYSTFRTDQMDDLLRAFHIFDGKPEPDHRSSIRMRMYQADLAGSKESSCEYMHVRWFKNSNAHITFKRLDLVDKLNAILSKHYPSALPAAR